jgi:hypothetical protein
MLGMAFAGIEYKAHDAQDYTKIDKSNLSIKIKDTLNISMIARDNFEEKRYYNSQTTFDGDIERFYGTNIRFDIKESNSNSMYLKIYKEANGISTLKAKELVNQIQYKYDTLNKDLLLDAYFLSDLKNRYRHQKVKLVLFIPKGKTIYLNKSTKYFLSNVDNVQDIYDRRMIRHFYKMTNEGLNCLDCDESNNNDDDIKNFKLKIDENGVDINLNKNKEVKSIKIDENGIEVK